MTFTITISTLKGKYDFNIERIYLGESIERFKVSRNGASITLRNTVNITSLVEAVNLITTGAS